MKCKACKNEIPNGSVFCMYCGERAIRSKKKQKDEIKIPKPTKLPSGAWRIQLRAEGQSITEATQELCITKAKAIRAGFLERIAKAPKLSLSEALDKYISAKEETLSPSTIYNYKKIAKNHFISYQNTDISSIEWRKVIIEESKRYSAKSIQNAWGLIHSAMLYNGLQPPVIQLPSKEPKELPWLNFEEIEVFLKAIYNQKCEMAALLALHSLRRSELLAITPSKIDKDGIHVDGSKVYTSNGLIEKSSNKTAAAKRVVPIMIPRLQELIDNYDGDNDMPLMRQYFQTAYKHINAICKDAGLPSVGYHGLRRSFASLAYHLGWSEREAMLIGGWDDLQTMHKIYIKLSQSDVTKAADKMRQFYSELHAT